MAGPGPITGQPMHDPDKLLGQFCQFLLYPRSCDTTCPPRPPTHTLHAVLILELVLNSIWAQLHTYIRQSHSTVSLINFVCVCGFKERGQVSNSRLVTSRLLHLACQQQQQTIQLWSYNFYIFKKKSPFSIKKFFYIVPYISVSKKNCPKSSLNCSKTGKNQF